jgi:hypothetical protein
MNHYLLGTLGTQEIVIIILFFFVLPIALFIWAVNRFTRKK